MDLPLYPSRAFFAVLRNLLGAESTGFDVGVKSVVNSKNFIEYTRGVRDRAQVLGAAVVFEGYGCSSGIERVPLDGVDQSLDFRKMK
jgi:hypothetical protein